MLERDFQAKLIKEIEERFPGSKVMKNDADYKQGIPDLSVFCEDGQWAMLECKASKNAKHQPNQDYYISWAEKAGFGAFVYPENKEEVLNAMERSFQAKRESCAAVSQ